MQDDEWRVEVDLDDDRRGLSLGERLRALDLDDDARERLGGGVVVTRDGSHVFLYTTSEAAAREAERVVTELAAADDLSVDISVTRWHPDEEEWKDASLPMPRTEAERAAERARHVEAERREAEEEGTYDWHVRVQLPHRSDAVSLAERLGAEGMPVQQRWRYLTIGALTEEAANDLGGRLREEVGDDAEVWVEVNREDLPNPLFVLLGRWL